MTASIKMNYFIYLSKYERKQAAASSKKHLLQQKIWVEIVSCSPENDQLGSWCTHTSWCHTDGSNMGLSFPRICSSISLHPLIHHENTHETCKNRKHKHTISLSHYFLMCVINMSRLLPDVIHLWAVLSLHHCVSVQDDFWVWSPVAAASVCRERLEPSAF